MDASDEVGGIPEDRFWLWMAGLMGIVLAGTLMIPTGSKMGIYADIIGLGSVVVLAGAVYRASTIRTERRLSKTTK